MEHPLPAKLPSKEAMAPPSKPMGRGRQPNRGGPGHNPDGRRQDGRSKKSYNHASKHNKALMKQPLRRDVSRTGEDDRDKDEHKAIKNEDSSALGKGTILLQNTDTMITKQGNFYPLYECGSVPEGRGFAEHLEHGVMNIDKPANPSSHEVVAWVKKVLKNTSLKTGHSGTLDPKVTGCLIVCMGKATRLVKSQQRAGKEYICVLRLHKALVGGEAQISRVLESFLGSMFQRPPVISAVKRQLRVRVIHQIRLIEYTRDRNLVTFSVNCEAGTYLRTLCIHIGYALGVGAHMQELRRTRSGLMDYTTNMRTMHDFAEACWMWRNHKDDVNMKEVVMPLEVLLVKHKRIVIKDTAVSAICHGAKLTATGVIKYDRDIQAREEVVLVSTKGEAVSLAITEIAAEWFQESEHGIVARVKRNIMDRDVYEKAWGKGPMAVAKHQLKEAKQLDKYGRPTEQASELYSEFFAGYSSIPPWRVKDPVPYYAPPESSKLIDQPKPKPGPIHYQAGYQPNPVATWHGNQAPGTDQTRNFALENAPWRNPKPTRHWPGVDDYEANRFYREKRGPTPARNIPGAKRAKN